MTEPSRITVNDIEFAYLEAGPADGPLALCLPRLPRPRAHLAPADVRARQRRDTTSSRRRCAATRPRASRPTGTPGRCPSRSTHSRSPTSSRATVTRAHRSRLGGDRLVHRRRTSSGSGPEVRRPRRAPRERTDVDVLHTAPDPAIVLVFLFQKPLAEMVARPTTTRSSTTLELLVARHLAGPRVHAGTQGHARRPGSLEAAIRYYRYTFGTIPGNPDPAAGDATGAGPTTCHPVPPRHRLRMHGGGVRERGAAPTSLPRRSRDAPHSRRRALPAPRSARRRQPPHRRLPGGEFCRPVTAHDLWSSG